MNLHKQRGMSLVAVSVLFMILGLVAMGFLYTIRYGHLPMQEVWARWGKSANVIGKELKNASGIPDSFTPATGSAPGAENMPAPVTVESGVKRCVINGKTVYSDTDCHNNATATTLKLQDTQGFQKPKPAADAASASSPEQDARIKMIEKAIEKASK
ncbi:hypothetical protein [Undibacterium curvum]|uniref:hypothetical protein n=1 Tax=Undibacterium curvum TaxID=2762294 RepID=UPI003D0E3A4C